MADQPYYFLDTANTDPRRLKKEREKARELRQSDWWKKKIAEGLCHHCGKRFPPKELTMDHLVPLARGGVSSKNNIVPACKACNAGKKLDTPVDELLRKISEEKK